MKINQVNNHTVKTIAHMRADACTVMRDAYEVKSVKLNSLLGGKYQVEFDKDDVLALTNILEALKEARGC